MNEDSRVNSSDFEDNRGCGCQNQGGLFNGLFNNNGNNGCGDNGILFFLIVFLLLFTNCGCNK